jgi:hypothetical protein
MTSTPRHQGRRHLARLALVAALTLATGCGGSNAEQQPQQTATEAWADDVCTSVSDWIASVEHSQAMLGDKANLSPGTVRHALKFVADATSAFVTDLKEIGPPDTEAGQAAEQQLSTLSGQLQEQADVVTRTLDQSSGNLQELLAQLSAVSEALSTMVADTTKAVDDIRQLDGAAELESAFQDSPTCQQLRASDGPSGG